MSNVSLGCSERWLSADAWHQTTVYILSTSSQPQCPCDMHAVLHAVHLAIFHVRDSMHITETCYVWRSCRQSVATNLMPRHTPTSSRTHRPALAGVRRDLLVCCSMCANRTQEATCGIALRCVSCLFHIDRRTCNVLGLETVPSRFEGACCRNGKQSCTCKRALDVARTCVRQVP